MLILTRKSEESIMIGNDITIKVLNIKGNQVHIGISAPKNVAIYRHEIYEQVLNENRKAATKSSKDLNKISSLKKLIMGKK